MNKEIMEEISFDIVSLMILEDLLDDKDNYSVNDLVDIYKKKMEELDNSVTPEGEKRLRKAINRYRMEDR